MFDDKCQKIISKKIRIHSESFNKQYRPKKNIPMQNNKLLTLLLYIFIPETLLDVNQLPVDRQAETDLN